MSRLPNLSLGFLLVVLGSAASRIPGQDALPDYRRQLARYEAGARNHSPENVRKLDGIIRGFADIHYGRDRETRGAAEKLLRGIVTQGGAEIIYRLRVAALTTLGRIARTPESVRFMLELARRRQREYEAISYWVVQALSRLRHPAMVATLARDGLRNASPAVRLVVLRGLAAIRDTEAQELMRGLEPLILEALKEKKPELRAAAIVLAGRLKLEAARPLVLKQLEASDPLIRLGVAEALGYLAGQPGTWKPLLGLLEDRSASVREEAVLAVERTGDVRGAPHLILRLKKEPLRIRTVLYGALEKLTGREITRDPKAWEDWWRAKGEGVLAGAAGAKGEAPPSDPRASRREQRGRYAVTYYGIPVQSDRIVFIIDISGSMEWGGDEPDEVRRIDLAKRELLKTVEALDKRTRFNLFAFSGSNTYFQPKGLFRASDENKRKVKRWLGNLAPRGGTNTHGVLEAVFDRFPEADTCYLLTDGSPTLGRVVVQEKILALVDDWNRRRGLRIHTITLLKGEAPNAALAALDDKDDAARFMSHLAAMTGGSFVRKEN